MNRYQQGGKVCALATFAIAGLLTMSTSFAEMPSCTWRPVLPEQFGKIETFNYGDYRPGPTAGECVLQSGTGVSVAFKTTYPEVEQSSVMVTRERVGVYFDLGPGKSVLIFNGLVPVQLGSEDEWAFPYIEAYRRLLPKYIPTQVAEVERQIARVKQTKLDEQALIQRAAAELVAREAAQREAAKPPDDPKILGRGARGG